jgi:CheY-like chemotaxis protein
MVRQRFRQLARTYTFLTKIGKLKQSDDCHNAKDFQQTEEITKGHNFNFTSVKDALMAREKTVLIIDDDRDFQTILGSILKKRGFNVLSLFDGPVLTALAAFQKPDVILLDFNLPHASGVDIGRELRSSPGTMNTPIIMISANDDIETLSKAAGADEFVGKPFTVTDLLGKIMKYFKKVKKPSA